MLGSDGKDSEERGHNSEDEGSLLWGGSQLPHRHCAPLWVPVHPVGHRIPHPARWVRAEALHLPTLTGHISTDEVENKGQLVTNQVFTLEFTN